MTCNKFVTFVILSSLFLTLSALEKQVKKYQDLNAVFRDEKDCKRLFLEDEINREYVQRNLPGGKTARIGDPCNYKEWLDIREAFLEEVWSGNITVEKLRERVGYQSTQAKNRSSIQKTFMQRWCIQCHGEPLLECASNNTCICYRKYKVEPEDEEEGFEKRKAEGIECKIRVGDPCVVFSEIDCETDAYCDSQTLKCKRRYFPEGESGESKPVMGMALQLLQIMIIILQTNY